MPIRPVLWVKESQPTIEGAGVHLHRAFGEPNAALDPFLLLDDFGSDDPADYVAGFPWHPHRGIETITYLLAGQVDHGDSLGNKGVIGPGDVQWMTAGGGIIHQEMPKAIAPMRGFQLWANLPAAHKMMRPRYRDVAAATIPLVEAGAGVQVRVVCGDVGGVRGPVTDIVTDPEYLDVRLAADAVFEHPLPAGKNGFAYVFEGGASFGDDGTKAERGRLVVFGDGDRARIAAGAKGARFLLVSGRPLKEPVAWGGPIVMNTREELMQAFEEYRNGTFIR
ncbi:MAG: pirin family protein [Myxococcales bacterium]|nr:MAG: pirin family protein [Myxococcales bacterium]